jgi:very-short-patch-repair endonuclease
VKHQPRGINRTNERELRRRLTDAEKLAWAILRSRNLQRWKFRTQHRIENMILDLYCPRLRLNVELDGDPHFTEEGKRDDAVRDERLKELGIWVVRFENRELIANPQICALEILRMCDVRAREFGYVKR